MKSELPVRSHVPEYRSTVVRFLASVDNAMADKAVEEAVHGFGGLLEGEIVNRLDGLQKVMNLEALHSAAPEWLNLSAYFFESLKLNSLALWANLMNDLALQDESLYSELREQTVPFGDVPVEDLRTLDMADAIASANTLLFGATTTGIFMGAAIGEDVKAITAFNPDLIGSGIRPLQAGLDIGEKFGKPAEDSDELLMRLRLVFPSTTIQSPENAYHSLDNANSFEGYHFSLSDSYKVVCPGGTITKRIYEGYGKLLENPDYQASFVERMTAPTL